MREKAYLLPMKIYIATASDFEWSHIGREEFKTMAQRNRKPQHGLTDDPHSADLILFIDFQQHLDDWWMGDFHRHPLVKKYPHKICVYDERDHPRYSAPGVYVSLTQQNRLAQSQCSGCYFNLKNETVDSTNHSIPEPDLLFSFMGAMSHPVRREITKISHPRAVVEDTSAFNFFAGDEDDAARQRIQRQKKRYLSIAQRSKFVLCPRGAGTSSYRLFETLSLGRVPVIISDQWSPVPGPDWEQCAVFVAEDQVANLPQLLETREAEFETLGANARAVWDNYFAPEVRFHNLIEACIAIKKTDTQGVCRHPRLQPVALRELARQKYWQLKNRLPRKIGRN